MPGRAEDIGDGRALIVGVLDGQQTAVAQQPASGRFDHARAVETVGAAPQRGVRVVIANLGVDRSRCASGR